MNISPTEAREALRDIDVSADQTRTWKGYQLAAPYFFIWGTIWIICYGASGLTPRGGILWLPATVIGCVLSGYVGRRNHAQISSSGANPRMGRNMWLTFIVFAIFMAATYAILPPHSPNQMNAYPALLSGMVYAVAGLWTRRHRLVAVGAFVAGATMIGFFFLAPWLSFWLAAVGGGSLILTGFWMRSA